MTTSMPTFRFCSSRVGGIMALFPFVSEALPPHRPPGVCNSKSTESDFLTSVVDPSYRAPLQRVQPLRISYGHRWRRFDCPLCPGQSGRYDRGERRYGLRQGLIRGERTPVAGCLVEPGRFDNLRRSGQERLRRNGSRAWLLRVP